MVRGSRIAALLLTAAVLLTMSGCLPLLNRTYYVEKDYAADETGGGETERKVRDSADIYRALLAFIQQHAENGKLIFSDYTGDMESELTQTIRRVKNESALGAFAVESISYETSRIVSYYEADVKLTYKRTAEQIDGIFQALSTANLREVLDAALAQRQTYLAVKTGASELDAGQITQMLQAAVDHNPLQVVLLPEMSFEIFPPEGSQRILEITLRYARSEEKMAQMQTDMETRARLLTQDAAWAESAGVRAYLLAQGLAGQVELTEDAATGYDALVLERADSRGLAMAYAEVCSLADIPCILVQGTYNGKTQYWNIVTIDGSFYHVDLSLWNRLGPANAFLAGDDAFRQNHSWDDKTVPACGGGQNYYSVMADFQASLAGGTD